MPLCWREAVARPGHVDRSSFSAADDAANANNLGSCHHQPLLRLELTEHDAFVVLLDELLDHAATVRTLDHDETAGGERPVGIDVHNLAFQVSRLHAVAVDVHGEAVGDAGQAGWARRIVFRDAVIEEVTAPATHRGA